MPPPAPAAADRASSPPSSSPRLPPSSDPATPPRPPSYPSRPGHPAPLSSSSSSSSSSLHSLALVLPVEILSHIFLLGFDPGIDPARPFKRRDLEHEPNFEVLVSHVCRRWRQVALHTPALWTGIRLRKPVHIDRAREFALRSRNQPLDILLDTVAAADYEPGFRLGIGEFDAGFRAAIDHTHRWRSLIVKVCDLPCKERARVNLRDCPPIPRLETLQLWHVQDWTDAANMLDATRKPPIPILSDDVPSLLNASLVGVNLAYPQTHYLAGLRQLELALHAEFCRPTAAEFEAILRDCPDLERLSLHYSGPRVDGSVDDDAPAVRMPKLTELALTNMDVDVVAHVVRRVAMPNLRALELELPALTDGLDFTPVVDWLAAQESPAFPRLEQLFVADLACDHAVWARWLASMPALRHLQVNFEPVGDAFFVPLISPASTYAKLVPELPSPSPSPSSPASPPASAPASASSTPSDSSAPVTPCASATTFPAASASAVLLPQLEHFKIARLPSARLRQLADFRKGAGVGVPHFHVHIKSVDDDTDKLQEDGFAVSYYGIEEAVEDLDEDEEAEGSEDEDEEDEDAVAVAVAVGQAPSHSGETHAHITVPHDGGGADEPASYDSTNASEYDNEEDYDDDDGDHVSNDNGGMSSSYALPPALNSLMA